MNDTTTTAATTAVATQQRVPDGMRPLAAALKPLLGADSEPRIDYVNMDNALDSEFVTCQLEMPRYRIEVSKQMSVSEILNRLRSKMPKIHEGLKFITTTSVVQPDDTVRSFNLKNGDRIYSIVGNESFSGENLLGRVEEEVDGESEVGGGPYCCRPYCCGPCGGGPCCCGPCCCGPCGGGGGGGGTDRVKVTVQTSTRSIRLLKASNLFKMLRRHLLNEMEEYIHRRGSPRLVWVKHNTKELEGWFIQQYQKVEVGVKVEVKVESPDPPESESESESESEISLMNGRTILVMGVPQVESSFIKQPEMGSVWVWKCKQNKLNGGPLETRILEDGDNFEVVVPYRKQHWM